MDQAKERVAHSLGKHSKLDCVESTRLTEREQERRMAWKTVKPHVEQRQSGICSALRVCNVRYSPLGSLSSYVGPLVCGPEQLVESN